MSTQPGALVVYLEAGRTKSFACAVDWPGWSRAGRSEEAALAALAAYAPRYAVVAEEAGTPLPAALADRVEVVERLPGDGTTDFGAPGKVATVDSRPLTEAEAARQAALVSAAWRVLDRVVAGSPATLRKGPRGGGRDRDAMVAHVLAAEAAYARKVGVRHPVPDVRDTAAVEALRKDLLEALAGARSGEPARPKGWPARYAARRIAWHVLDHAWEMQDRRTDG